MPQPQPRSWKQRFTTNGFTTEMRTKQVHTGRWNGWGVPYATIAEIEEYCKHINLEITAAGIENDMWWSLTKTRLPDGQYHVVLNIDPADDEPYVDEVITDLNQTIRIDGLVWVDATDKFTVADVKEGTVHAAETLLLGAEPLDLQIQCAIAAKAGISHKAVAALMATQEIEIELALAGNPSTSVTVLLELVLNGDPETRRAALARYRD